MLPLLWLFAILPYASSVENKFVQLLSKPYFVDKSLLLERFLSANASHFYISNPRRFGKTINLAMIENFFKIQVDKDGMPLPYNSTDTYRIFRGLKIRKHRTLISTHLAQYPVLSLSLLRLAKRTHRYSISSLNSELAEAVDNILWIKYLKRFFKYHRELFAATNERDLKFLGKLQNRKLNRHEIENALFVISRLLYHYFGKTPVIILIDDYDQAALNSYRYKNANVTLSYDLVNNMITRALHQGPKYIRNIVISGVTSLAYAHRGILASKMVHMPFLEDHAFAPFYGLGRSDLFDLFDRYDCDLPERKAIRKYYKAYETSVRKDLVYNMYSITRYFINRNDEPFRPELLISYWRQSEMEDHALPLINCSPFRHLVKDLLTNRSLKYPLEKVHPKDVIFQLQRLRESNYKNFEKSFTYLFVTIYFELGYLGYGPENDTYIIPNIEVRQIFKHQLRLYQQSKLPSTAKVTFVVEENADEGNDEEDDENDNENASNIEASQTDEKNYN